MTRIRSSSEVIVCVGLTREDATEIRAPSEAVGHLVLCNPAAGRDPHRELPPRWSSVRCAGELPFLSHCADAVALSARLLPSMVLLSEARRVLAPHGTVWVTPAIWHRADPAERAPIASALEAAGFAVDVGAATEWNAQGIVLARVLHGPRPRP